MIVVAYCLLSACAPDGTQNADDGIANSAQIAADSIEKVKSLVVARADSLENAIPRIHYRRFVVDTRTKLDSIKQTFAKTKLTWDAYRVFTLLNRKDIQFVRMSDTLILPDTILTDLRAYSVFPYYYAGAANIPKLLIISNEWQCYAAYEYGYLVRFAAANTGEERKPTFPGRYAANWKQRRRVSSLDSTWILPFTVNIHQYAGSAMHQFEMPGRPVSHSCVRQFLVDAEWVYHWVDVAKLDSNKRPIPYTGTPVIIHGLFDFRRQYGGPWLDLANNKPVIEDLPDSPMDVEQALIPMSQIPKVVRGGLPDKTRYAKAEEELRRRGWIREEVKLRESIDYNQLRRDRRRAKQRKAYADSSAKAAPVSQPAAPQGITPN